MYYTYLCTVKIIKNLRSHEQYKSNHASAGGHNSPSLMGYGGWRVLRRTHIALSIPEGYRLQLQHRVGPEISGFRQLPKGNRHCKKNQINPSLTL